MNNRIFNISDIDQNNIIFDNANKSIIYTKYHHNDTNYQLLFNIDKMAPYDIILENKTKYTTHELSLCFMSDINIDYLKQLDDFFINYGPVIKSQYINVTKYKSMIRIDNDRTQILKLKFLDMPTLKTIVYSIDNVELDQLAYGDVFKPDNLILVDIVIEIVGLWIRDDTYGPYVRLHKIYIDDQNMSCMPLLSSSSSSSSSSSNSSNSSSSSNSSISKMSMGPHESTSSLECTKPFVLSETSTSEE